MPIKSTLPKKLFRKQKGWGLGLVEASITTLEKYYDDLLQIEQDLRVMAEGDDFGKPDRYDTAAGELDREKRRVMKLIAEKKIKEARPPDRLPRHRF